jgi:NAD(P)-dependent dehydrogenase (short-subunit alcohol dehydrogenase family)
MSLLDGKVCVVSGGTSGIGARTAELFIEAGARVVIGGRRADRGEQLAGALGADARFIRTDVSVEADVKAMVDCALQAFGRIDCLFNNAGGPTQRAGIAAVDLDRFDQALGVHLRGTLAGMKHVVSCMVEQGSGSIINTASINGSRAGMGGMDYAVAKAGVIHLTRWAALELGEKGIRVNSISPGPIATGIFGKGPGSDHDAADEDLNATVAAIAEVLPRWAPLSKVGTVDDVAQVALFLASDASSLITGHDLVVDGGISAGWPAAVARQDLSAFAETFRASGGGRR